MLAAACVSSACTSLVSHDAHRRQFPLLHAPTVQLVWRQIVQLLRGCAFDHLRTSLLGVVCVNFMSEQAAKVCSCS
jgi:hypothetical protein